jgi:hypothetical protein
MWKGKENGKTTGKDGTCCPQTLLNTNAFRIVTVLPLTSAFPPAVVGGEAIP